MQCVATTRNADDSNATSAVAAARGIALGKYSCCCRQQPTVCFDGRRLENVLFDGHWHDGQPSWQRVCGDDAEASAYRAHDVVRAML